MSIWLILLFLAIGIIVILAIIGFSLERQGVQKTRQLFSAVDKKYNNYIEKYLTANILKTDGVEFDIEKTADDMLRILEPEINGLLSHIKASDLDNVTLSFKSDYFNSLVSLTQDYFNKYPKKEKPVSTKDKTNYVNAFRSAIVSDLHQRKLNLSLGEF